MIGLTPGSENAPKDILFLGAHCDDIEIGCGGTILLLKRRYPGARFHWLTFCSNEVRRGEMLASARMFLENDIDFVRSESFRDGFLPYMATEVKERFEALKGEVSPDLIFTHYRKDLHQDHRLVSDLTWNTFRNHLILEYEIPKWDGDMGIPNTFVSISEDDLRKKTRFLSEAYASQQGKQWFDEDTIRGLSRLRGVEGNSTTRFAEAFYARKLNLFAD